MAGSSILCSHLWLQLCFHLAYSGAEYTHVHIQTQAHTPTGNAASPSWNQGCFSFSTRISCRLRRGGGYLLLFLWASEGRLAFLFQEGLLLPGMSPSRRQQRSCGFKLRLSFPPFHHLPSGNPRLSLAWEQTLVQRNAACTRIPGSWEFIKCLSAIVGAGCHVLTPALVFHLQGEALPPH